MRNIFSMLKPGGNLFATFIVDSPLFETCDNMIKKQKWPPAMVPFKKNAYRGVDKPEAKLRFFLEQAGFEVQVCVYEERTYTFDGFKQFLGRLTLMVVLWSDQEFCRFCLGDSTCFERGFTK